MRDDQKLLHRGWNSGTATAPLDTARPTSANRSNQPTAVDAAQALNYLDGKVNLVLDGGPAPLSQESTVVSFVNGPARVLREGAISAGRLREALGQVDLVEQ